MIFFTVKGEAASKENSRRLVKIKGRVVPIKSAKAIAYAKAFDAQCPILDPLLEGDLEVWIKIYYASRRPDLDPSLIFDCMQKKIYANDRQLKGHHVCWGLDKENPRAEIFVRPFGEGFDPASVASLYNYRD